MTSPSGEPPANPVGMSRLAARLTSEETNKWRSILAAGAKAQQLISGSLAVGGTAAALYAGHRISHDVDNLLPNLKNTFDEVLDALEQAPAWMTARIKKPVLILGNIDGIEIGFRQARRTAPIASTSVTTSHGVVIIPTLAEMIGMKAYLAYARNAVRDFLDFAALTTSTEDAHVLDALSALDRHYGHLQSASVALEVAKCLSKPEPTDLQETDLSRYRALAPEWHDWRRTERICQHFGLLLGQRLIGGKA